MRIAAIADIHGNLGALEAVLSDIGTREVDLVVNLGDVFSGPLFPAECADLLIPLSFPTIRGNHERQLLTLSPKDMGLSDRYASLCLRPDHLSWIAGLPETLWISKDVLLVHGTPSSDVAYFLESVDDDGIRPASIQEVQSRLGGIGAELTLCGHTHVPRSARLDDGRVVVNPGSVGLPAFEDVHPYPHRIEIGSPHARYAIVEEKARRWSAELIAVEYDWDKAAAIAEKRGRPDWAHALRTGLV